MSVRFSLWHPSGVPAEFQYENSSDPAKEAFSLVSAHIKAGWKAHEPQPGEAGDGEETFTVTHLLRRELERDGRTTVVIDMYADHPMMKHKFLAHYLNTPAMVEAFEAGSGVKVQDVKFSLTGIERGKTRAGDQALTTVPHPFEIVVSHNPNYNPDETDVSKKKPKFLFGRWPKKDADHPVQTTVPGPFDRDAAIKNLLDLYVRLKTTWRDAIGRTEAALKNVDPTRSLNKDLGPEQLSDDEIRGMTTVLESRLK